MDAFFVWTIGDIMGLAVLGLILLVAIALGVLHLVGKVVSRIKRFFARR